MSLWEGYNSTSSVPWDTGKTVPSVENIPQPQFPPSALEMLPPHPFGALRKAANAQGGALLIYHLILNAAVMIVVFAASFALAFQEALGNASANTEALVEKAMEASGWGYLLAVAIGLLSLLLWKKPRYVGHTILQKGKPITFDGFFALLSLMMSAQLVAQMCNLALEWLLDLIGLDGSALQQLGNVDTDSLSMFLYIGIIAPISEELLFRGLVLRGIEPYGKKLAVIGSAILFGLYHANPIQTPYAILAGLVLGYVALEYHVIWAIAMHMFNNLVFAMLLPQALSFLPVVVIDWILWALIIGFFVAAVLILLLKRSQAAAIWKRERVQPWQSRAFFRAPAIIVLIVVCMINLAATMLLLFQ